MIHDNSFASFIHFKDGNEESIALAQWWWVDKQVENKHVWILHLVRRLINIKEMWGEGPGRKICTRQNNFPTIFSPKKSLLLPDTFLSYCPCELKERNFAHFLGLIKKRGLAITHLAHGILKQMASLTTLRGGFL